MTTTPFRQSTATVRYEVVEDGDTVTITAVLVSEADEFPAGRRDGVDVHIHRRRLPGPGRRVDAATVGAVRDAAGHRWRRHDAVGHRGRGDAGRRRNPGRCAPPRAALVRTVDPALDPPDRGGAPVALVA